jgi:hypothetical protein
VAVDPSGRFVYAIGQNTSADGTFQQGNQLHILPVAPDGTLSEPTGPVIFAPGDVPGTAHPQGIAVVPSVGVPEKDPDRPGESHSDSIRPGESHSGSINWTDVLAVLLRDRHAAP